MTGQLERSLDDLRGRISDIGRRVAEQVETAIEALVERDKQKSKAVYNGDVVIDELEVEAEEECLKVLALYQPKAKDLRFVVAVLKINNDLERIGDLAVNIAQRAHRLVKLTSPISLDRITDMASETKAMLKRSIDALIALDAERARSVLQGDDIVDDMNREMHKHVLDSIQDDPSRAPALMLTLSVSKNLERIADLASNIAEEVIYSSTGEIVRHGRGRDNE